eukprot:14005784-Alexandrium_andersonii.AAC.1
MSSRPRRSELRPPFQDASPTKECPRTGARGRLRTRCAGLLSSRPVLRRRPKLPEPKRRVSGFLSSRAWSSERPCLGSES